MKTRRLTIKRWLWPLCCAVMLLGAAFCLGRLHVLARSLPAQEAARRWRGESGQDFAQVSVYLPVDEPRSQSDIYAFRYAMLDELHKAALDADGADGLWLDAWSCTDKLTVSSSRASGEASVTAVGGAYFSFHPIRLLSGSYLTEDDLMKDMVLLDEDLAWLLFGGTQLQGMTVEIQGEPFVVGGVIRREEDAASTLAYTAGQGLYMSYETYARMKEKEAAITCYEVVMAEPVKGFAQRTVQEQFKPGRGELVQNTGRFSYGRLLKLLTRHSTRSMQAMGLMYPYWENAARVVEDRCMWLLLFALLLALPPLVTLLLRLWRLLRRGKEGLEDKVLPKLRDDAEEAVRVRQRRRWEKKHGLHEKKQP